MTPSCVEWKLRLRTVQHESNVNMSDFAYQFLVNPKKILNKCVQKENLSYDTTISHCDFFNPLTPMSDQDRISPNNINTISSRKVTRIKKSIN